MAPNKFSPAPKNRDPREKSLYDCSMTLIPTRESVLQLLTDSPAPMTKREIVQAFDLKGDEDRIALKKLLKEMEDNGLIVKQPGQAYAIPDALPEVLIVEITEVDVDGDVIATPVDWDLSEKGPAPRIEISPEGKGHPALMEGDRALIRVQKQSKDFYTGKVIRSLATESGRVLGMIEKTKTGFVLRPANRKIKNDYEIQNNDLNGAKPGDLAVGEVQPVKGRMRPRVRIRDVIGKQGDPKAISLVAMHEAGLRAEFPAKAIEETKSMTVPDIGKREDFRSVPLVTIDGADARDFDDAVFAEKENDGTWHLIVAIADVSYYVRPGTELDREAFRRGNSTYFPDRVVPMLPEALSNDLCSLRPGEDRACLAVHMWINDQGALLRHKFARGLMRSIARLTYEQVQDARDGKPSPATDGLMDNVIKPLYEAYKILDAARQRRGALDLDIPERKIILNEKGEMIGVKPRARLDSHKLIEEFMVLANVAAAQALESKSAPCLYRVHDRPDPDRIDNIREFIESFGLSLPHGQISKPHQINHVLVRASDMEYGHLVHQMLLRAQMQAHYDPENIGHFGLALQRYAHFTSPIRRYADLVVHRSLTKAFGFGPGGLSDEEEMRMDDIAGHISQTERTSAEAERNAVDRFAATYLAQHQGDTFTGRINGVTSFGLFVTLDDSGVDGLVPIRSLPHDYYIHDDRQHALIGQRGRLVYRMGAPVRVAVIESDPLTGSSIFEILGQGADLPGVPFKMPAGGRGGPRGRDRGRAGRQKPRKNGQKGPSEGPKGPKNRRKR